MKKTFSEKVIEIVKRIPKGKTMTYLAVAKKAGSPNAARAVGSIMKQNSDKNVPCHRVIRSDGGMGGYNGLIGKKPGLAAKLALLKKEGVRL
jgi:methylated-DNA-[protein]-cysteine S-methyltransferase